MGNNEPEKNAICCIKSTEYSIHTRRCFITGEYCSQQTNIQKDRQKLHEKGAINAFVVMNFSSMSDVVYEARMKPFIEGLKKYLYLDKDGKRIACISSGNLEDINDNSLSQEQIDDQWKPVSHIHVHRADTNPVSNYIICNRICQQMQIADLIIVDVSVESANVFYEFGLATAFQKLILPICFSDSFYAEKLPKKLEELLRDDEFSHWKTTPHSFKCHGGFHNWNTLPQKLKHHIDCFPWRRKLYEHFGIRYAGEDDHVSYLAFSKATDDRFGFSDTQYRKFPYRDKKNENGGEVGEIIYCWLRDNYNLSETTPARYNTLVRYTMDGFLEGDQAGLCIVNFYNNIIRPMHEQYCFCGDRVAVLGQPNKIWDDPKDSKTGSSLLYNVSDLIRIGMDQATYMAERKRIKTGDYLMPEYPELQNGEAVNLSDEDIEAIKKQVKKQVKNHIRNRTIPLNPENPIYVTQYKDGIQRNLDDIFYGKKYVGSQSRDPRFSCMYHVMLDTMRYVNEIVVDLSSNSIQAMFWLGAAHGSDVYAVTVRHEMSEQEKSWSGRDSIDHDRPIFDIAGLWTAMLRYGEMDSFYKQLELIQQGIDQHAKLKLPEMELEPYEKEVYRLLHKASPYYENYRKNIAYEPDSKNQGRINKIIEQLRDKSRAESQALESYYRDRFWRQMLRDNQLHLFLNLDDTSDKEGPRLQIIKWDMDTVAELSHYLSKRKIIGKYQFDTLRKNRYYGQGENGSIPDSKKNAQKENFIVIGSGPKPMCLNKKAVSLADYLNNKPINKPVRFMLRESGKYHDPRNICTYFQNRYFHACGDFRDYIFQYLGHDCIKCDEEKRKECRKARKDAAYTPDIKQPAQGVRYYLPAQLLLWREEQPSKTENVTGEEEKRTEYKFHVSLAGVSGPATKALTALLVDDEQKDRIWGREGTNLQKDISENLKRYLPLNTLQTHIRRKFYEKFDAIRKDKQDARLDTVVQLSLMYLSTILPQYFLPFLSKSDEKRIYFGLEAFLRSIDCQNTKEFEAATKTILDALKNTLSSFRGIDALYLVTVSAKPTSQDDRSIENIELLKPSKNSPPEIACLYIE